MPYHLLIYFCTLLGMAWSSVQDLATRTVTVPPLLVWGIGTLAHCLVQGPGWGFPLALLYCLLLRPYLHLADGVVTCLASLWFDPGDLLYFSFFTGVSGLFLHWCLESRQIPMIPAVAAGWSLTHFLNLPHLSELVVNLV